MMMEALCGVFFIASMYHLFFGTREQLVTFVLLAVCCSLADSIYTFAKNAWTKQDNDKS